MGHAARQPPGGLHSLGVPQLGLKSAVELLQFAASMGSTLLEMKDITRTFPGVKALSNVSFQIERGEIHCLVGENGAGKSTLMKVPSGGNQQKVSVAK